MTTTSRPAGAGPATSGGPASDVATAAWGGLLQVHAGLVPVLDRELQSAAGLPLAWYDVLLELNEAPDRRLRMSELGGKVVLSRTRVSRLVDEMAASGLVQREAHPTDRRSAYAVITEAGRRSLRRAAPVYLIGIRTHFGRHATDEELAVVAKVLWRVHEAEKPDTAALTVGG